LPYFFFVAFLTAFLAGFFVAAFLVAMVSILPFCCNTHVAVTECIEVAKKSVKKKIIFGAQKIIIPRFSTSFVEHRAAFVVHSDVHPGKFHASSL
jgi:hypothetical protein